MPYWGYLSQFERQRLKHDNKKSGSNNLLFGQIGFGIELTKPSPVQPQRVQDKLNLPFDKKTSRKAMGGNTFKFLEQ